MFGLSTPETGFRKDHLDHLCAYLSFDTAFQKRQMALKKPLYTNQTTRIGYIAGESM